MYAVTGSPKEYQEHQDDDGAVTLHLIEVCESENDDPWADYAGWEMYWYNDGSPTGCICIDTAEVGVHPVGLEIDDVFSPAQIETLCDKEYTVIPAPFGVRHRTISEEDHFNCDYCNITSLMQSGRLDHWKKWESRLCQDTKTS